MKPLFPSEFTKLENQVWPNINRIDIGDKIRMSNVIKDFPSCYSRLHHPLPFAIMNISARIAHGQEIDDTLKKDYLVWHKWASCFVTVTNQIVLIIDDNWSKVISVKISFKCAPELEEYLRISSLSKWLVNWCLLTMFFVKHL